MSLADKQKYFGLDGNEQSDTEQGSQNAPGLVLLVGKGIVENVIGKVLLDDTSDGNDLSVFDWLGFEGDGNGEFNTNDRRTTSVKNEKQFRLAIGYVPLGSSFRLASRILESTRKRAGVSDVGSCSEAKAPGYVRIARAANFQKLSDLVAGCWAFSAAMDSSSKSSESCLDVRLRIPLGPAIHNLHLIAIPLGPYHTGEHMCNCFANVMDSLPTDWRRKVIGISTDGARGMAGCHQGAATRLQAEASAGFYRVWCGAHQLNLVIQRAVKSLRDEMLIGRLTSLIGRLRRQQALIHEMKATCPRFAGARWLSIGKALKWLVRSRARVMEYLEEKNPPCKPRLMWWVVL